MQIKIIVAEIKHVEDCLESLRSSGIGERYFSDREYTSNLIRKGIGRKEIFMGINGNNSVSGFYWASDHCMFCRFPYLRMLAVKPVNRNAGTGRKLLEDFEKNAFIHASKLFLTVSDFNTAALRFYERNGYTRVGTIPELYKNGIDEILMMKTSPIQVKGDVP